MKASQDLAPLLYTKGRVASKPDPPTPNHLTPPLYLQPEVQCGVTIERASCVQPGQLRYRRLHVPGSDVIKHKLPPRNLAPPGLHGVGRVLPAG